MLTRISVKYSYVLVLENYFWACASLTLSGKLGRPKIQKYDIKLYQNSENIFLQYFYLKNNDPKLCDSAFFYPIS